MFKKQYDIEEKPLLMNFLQKQLAIDAVKNSSFENLQEYCFGGISRQKFQ